MSVASGQYSQRSAVLPPNRPELAQPPRAHQQHLTLQVQTTHPAAFASDPDAEYSPLEAPALPFSASGTPRRPRTRSAEVNGRHLGSILHARPTSSSSLPSLAAHSGPDSQPYPPKSDSSESLPSTFSRRDMHGRGLSDAQEELLLEARNDRENGKDQNPYAWERPLDSINRHSRMLDSSPLTTASDPTGRRVSRLPPGVQMLDPFGFSLAADASPYDLALNASSPSTTPAVLSPSRSPVRASFLQPHPPSTAASTSSHGHSQFPSSSSIASNLSSVSTAATTPTLQPWTKPRAASAGEVYQLNSRAQFKSGLLGPPPIQRGASARSRLSKLSGEIEAETAAIEPTAAKAQLPAFVPADSDYLNSKLYARTLKAQKALERERVKAASKGKMSRYDSEAAKSTSSLAVPRTSTDTGRPASIMSVASAGKVRAGRRSGLGWFKSSSEVALSPPTIEPAFESPPLPIQPRSTALPIGSRSFVDSVQPSPPAAAAAEPVLRSTNSSSDYLREARESVAVQKAPPMSSRQPSGSSSSSSSSSGGELVRPGPLPMRKSRASPSGSFQHSPTIRESSPPGTPVDEAPLDQVPPPFTTQLSTANPLMTAERPSRYSSLEAPSRATSTTPTPDPTSSQQASHSAIPHRISSTTLKPSTGMSNQASSSPHISNGASQGLPEAGPPADRPHRQPVLESRLPQSQETSQIPFPRPQTIQPQREPTRSTPGPISPIKPQTLSKPTAPSMSVQNSVDSIVPPPLLAPDASLANGAEVGVKRRKSALGLLFGGGGSGRTGKNTPSPAMSPQSIPVRERSVRESEERSRIEATVVKEKTKEKVKEGFFGRVKRPELPVEKAKSPSSSTRTVSSRPMQSPEQVQASVTRRQPAPASRLPPGAQPPVLQYSPLPTSSPSLPPTPRQRSEVATSPETAIKAPDSSSSASTEFSTLSSSSSTLPPTPSSGRSSHGLSKSLNSSSTKANGGGNAFSNFFSRHRTKSMGPTASTGPQKLSRSKNSTPTPEDHLKQTTVLPSKGNFVDRTTPLPTKHTQPGTPQTFSQSEKYFPVSSAPSNEILTTSQRGHPTYA